VLPSSGCRFKFIKSDNAGMNAEYLFERLTVLSYRVASYAMLNLADDAAMLAFIFC
jgi:hypothetical protein